LGSIIAGFKAAVTRRVNTASGVKIPLWQRNYYEHVIRSDDELHAIRDYIAANPARWEEDEYH
jgi:REP element-mobilizing transposase RayT